MGEAMLRAWLNAGLKPSNIFIADPSAHETSALDVNKKQWFSSVLDIESKASPSVVVLAVKPQIIPSVLAELGTVSLKNTLIISVAAGTTIAELAKEMDSEQAIVRAMPNIPAMVGKGMTAMVKNPHVSENQQLLVNELFAACGTFLWLDDEDGLNAVTAVSGSGPAYIFYMLEAMAEAGVKLGLSAEVSEKLARQTIIGAAALLEDSETPAQQLRENVTSPKGTTAAALEVLMANDGLVKLMLEAMSKARDRAQELSPKN